MHKRISHIFALVFAHLRFYGRRSGLSVLELLIFSAIFTFVMLAFITVLVTVVNINARQTGAAEVNQQSQFLLEQFRYYIERSSLVELPQDTSTTTLRLRMRASSEDPAIFTLADGRVYLQKATGTKDPLTSTRVNVSNISFAKHSNPPGKDSVDVSFTVEYAAGSGSIGQRFVQSLRTAIARVSAATFDSNVTPSSTDAYVIGTGPLRWSSINGVIYFSAANPPSVGIGVSSPLNKLHIAGGNVYISDSPTGLTAGNLVMRDPGQSYCWYYKPTTLTGAWNISSSTCP